LNAILQLIGFLFSGLGAGISRIRTLAPSVARPYVKVLEKLTIFAVGIVTAFVLLGFLAYWVSQLAVFSFLEPMWRIFMLAGGLFAFAFGFLFSVLAAPIVALVAAATVMPPGTTATTGAVEALPWYRWLSPIGLLREVRNLGGEVLKAVRSAINQYIEAARFVLVVSGFWFFFFSFMPRPSVTLLLASLLGLGAVWLNRAYKGIWSWLAQAGVLSVLAFYVLILRFPNVKWFSLLFPTTTPNDLTEGGIKAGARGVKGWMLSWDWFDSTVAAIVLAGGVLLFRWLIQTAPKLKAEATEDEHHKAASAPHDAHAKSSVAGVLGTAVLLLTVVGLVLIIGMGFQGCQREHREVVAEAKARQDLLREQAAAVREARLARPSRPTTPQLVQTGTNSSTAAPADGSGTVWRGLKNPAKHSVDFTNDMWSPRIPRPPRMEGRLEPNLRPVEVRVSGAGDPQGTGRFWRDGDILKAEDAFLEYRFPKNTNVVSVTIGMGYRATN